MNNRIKKWIAAAFIGLTALSTVGCTPADEAQTLTISAAASLKNVMEEITPVFEKENEGIALTFNYGSSGDLQKQIENGAPADVFISAAEKQMNELEEEGLIEEESREDLVKNELVLIVPKGQDGITSFRDLTDDGVTQVALGEPSAVPAGQYAEEVLSSLGILEQVSEKAVYGKDVTQVLTYVENGEVQAGLVYKTDAASSDKVEIVAIAPKESYQEVIYPAALIKNSSNYEAGTTFMTFLQREDVKRIFEKYGFSIVE